MNKIITLSIALAFSIPMITAASANDQDTRTVMREFAVSGTARVSGSAVVINNHKFLVDASTKFEDQLTVENISGRYVEIEGLYVNGNSFAKEIEADYSTAKIDLEGPVKNNHLWSYDATDRSLEIFNNSWVSVECRFDGQKVSACVVDD